MKTCIYIIIFAGIISLLTACKKYPEGGYTKQGPKRILGNWQLTLYEVNGIDSTDLINYNGNDNYKDIEITKLATSGTNYTLRINNSVGIGFNFIDKNKSLEVSSSYASIYCPTITSPNDCYRIIYAPEGGNYNVWKIIKLNKTELTLSCDLINNYIIKFKK